MTQPYEQMAEVLRKIGLQDEVLSMLVQKNLQAAPEAIFSNLQRTARYLQVMNEAWPWEPFKRLEYSWKTLWAFGKAVWAVLWYYGLGWSIGYGYRPWRALLPTIVIIINGWKWFGKGYPKLMIPTDSNAYIPGTTTLQPFYPKFNSFVYSVEKFVPLLKLEIGDYWAPDQTQKQGMRLNIYLWLHIVAGYVFTTLFAGAISGLVK
jgi:hypothetical protein